MITTSSKEQLILDLHTVGAIKFGSFILKSGITSPFYIDLRVLVSYPYLLDLTTEVFWEAMRIYNFDVLVGVPYTAIPIATSISLKHNRPMIFVRKERKGYGTDKLIEGEYHKGQKAIIIDDVITNGESKLMTIQPLEKEGLTVKHIIVLLDRCQGGPKLINNQGYSCHVIYTMYDVFSFLLKHRRISKEQVEKCLAFIKKSQFTTKKVEKHKKK